MYDINHIGIVVKDCKKSIAFYKEILGAKVIDEINNDKIKIIFLKLGNQILELIQYLDISYKQRSAGSFDHIAINVADINKEVERIKKMGVNCLFDSPREVLAGKKIMFFVGPDGEKIEFIEQN